MLERRSDLVLHDLDSGAVAHRFGATLQRFDSAHIQANRRVELQCLAAGGGLRGAEHHADLLAQLVDEDRGGMGLIQSAGHLAQRLTHQACLQTHMAIAHLPFDLGPRHECGDGVHDDQVEGPRAHQGVHDLQGLLTGIGLGHVQVVEVDTEIAGVHRIECVLGVDECAQPACGLSIRDRVQRDGGLARRLRTVDLHNAPPRQAADSQCGVQGDRSGRDDLDRGAIFLTQSHDGAFAELALDLRQGGLQSLFAVIGGTCHGSSLRSRHAWCMCGEGRSPV